MKGLCQRIMSGDRRSVAVRKNIVASFALKGVSVLISLQVVPLTIGYVDSERYGIWLTLSSLVAWFYFFDIGLTHGFRNRFAEAMARGDIGVARIYVSTTYAALAAIFSAMIVVAAVANEYADWSRILNLDPSYGGELSRVFMIVISFCGLNIVFSTFTTMLTADQKPAVASLVNVSGQAVALGVIYLLTRLQTDGSLVRLAWVFSGIPVAVVLLWSIILYGTRYRDVAPAWGCVKLNRVKDILGLGSEFFVITASMLFIFNLMNVIISRELGPGAVTEYNVAYKYFGVLYMFVVLILNPFWSAFTDAYTRRDYAWMQRMFVRLERLWLPAVPILAAMLMAAPRFYGLWVGDTVAVPQETSLAVAAYMLLLIFGNIYMYMINGIGKVRIQLLIYLSFAVIAFPSMTFMCRRWGIAGLLTVPACVYAAQGLLCRMQLRRVLHGRATGLWDK